MRLRTVAWTLLAALVGAAPSEAQQLGPAQISPQALQGSANYGQLPLTFEANHGQANPQVKFLSRGKGYTAAFLTTGGITLSLRSATAAATQVPQNPATTKSQPPNAFLQFNLVGAAANPAVVGETLQPGRINYFIGNDKTKWHTDVPTYASVRYKNVYPGIDLVYYGNHRQLEYDFAIAPGADPRQIEFEITGASQVELDSQGDLSLQTSSGNLYFQSPVVYQESQGLRVPVAGAYVVNDPTHISFQVAQYDSSKPLVIDPVLVYSTYLGGSGNDQPAGIAVDSTGSVYIAGYTDSEDFQLAIPQTALARPRRFSKGRTDHVFIAKLDPTGSNLVYADYIGGSSNDYGYALALDSANNVYVTGSTESSDFPLVNPYQTYPGSFNAFLSKISADGSTLLYSTYLGGNGTDQASSIGVDGSGDMLVAGNTTSTNFPVANAYQATASPNQGGIYGTYGFLTKFNPAGSSLIYSTYAAGNSNVALNCAFPPCWPSPYSAIQQIAVDSNGNAYATGTTNTYNFPTTTGAYLTTDSTQQDAVVGFVSKFSGSGNLDYSTYFYESSGVQTNPNAIAVDGSGSAYVTGAAVSDGTFPLTSPSICDPSVNGAACGYAFVTKFDPSGSSLLYSTFLGANNYATPVAIALDADNDAYVLASTPSNSFGITNGIEPYTTGSEILLVEIDPSAGSELFATYLGGTATGYDIPAGIALDSNGNLYVAGSTASTDFPVTQGAFQKTLAGSVNNFVMKIGPSSAPAVSANPWTLQYAIQQAGTTSQPQTVLLRNMGSSALSISSATATGDFAETDNCGSSVPAAGSCTLSVTFTPTAAGTRSGSILIQDDAAGSPQAITLSGVGLAANVVLTPASLTFSSLPVSTSSTSQTETLTNTGNAPLSISTVQLTGNYTETNNCPATLPSNSSCTINIVFTPTATGVRNGTLTINDNAPGAPQTVNLTGSGSDFSLAISPSQDTIKAGSTATYTLSVSAVGGSFPNAVTLSCSGLPKQAACSFSPAKVTPGAGIASAKLTITTGESSAQAAPTLPAHNHFAYAFWIQLQGFGLFGMIVAISKKRSKRVISLVLLAVLAVALMFMSGCAGGTGTAPQTPPGNGNGTTYTVTVTGTSGALQHSQPVTLTIQ